MSTTLPELFNQMNSLGLTFRRSTAGELEVLGDISRLTDAIRQAIGAHRQTILACLPQASPAAPAISTTPRPEAAANAIRQQLDEFSTWLGKYAAWAQPRYLDRIDRRLAEAVDSQNIEAVRLQIEALISEVEAINWAEFILPRSFEVEAKHAAAAGAGPAADSVEPDGIPF